MNWKVIVSIVSVVACVLAWGCKSEVVNMPDASEPTVSTNLARVEDGYMFDGINDYLEIHTDIYLEGYYTLANLENMIKRWKKYEKENGRAQ